MQDIDENSDLRKNTEFFNRNGYCVILKSDLHIQKFTEIIDLLLDTEFSYRCFCTKENLAQKRAKSEKETGGYIYDGTCRNLTENQIAENIEPKAESEHLDGLIQEIIKVVDNKTAELEKELKTKNKSVKKKKKN